MEDKHGLQPHEGGCAMKATMSCYVLDTAMVGKAVQQGVDRAFPSCFYANGAVTIGQAGNKAVKYD